MRTVRNLNILDGSQTQWLDRLHVGLLQSVALPAPVSGGATGAIVLTPGSFTSVPALVAADGSSGVFAAVMGATACTVGAKGTNYAPGDTIVATGGTQTQNAVVQVDSTELISAALNAKGSGYVPNDTVTLNGGAAAVSTPAQITVTTTELVSAALNAAGTGYVVADTVTLLGGTAATKAILTVSKIQLVTAAHQRCRISLRSG
jgi:hypothetical protein